MQRFNTKLLQIIILQTLPNSYHKSSYAKQYLKMYNRSRHHMESLPRDKYQALECKDNSLMVLCLISFQSKTRLHMTQMELILQSGSSNACPNHNQAFISMQQRLQSKKPNYISPDSIVSECNRYCYTHEETQNVEVALETRRLYLGNPFISWISYSSISTHGSLARHVPIAMEGTFLSTVPQCG